MISVKYILSLALLFSTSLLAQNPREIRLDNDPFDFTDPVKLIFILIIPLLLLIIGAIMMRRRKRKK